MIANHAECTFELLLNNGEVKIPTFPAAAINGDGVLDTLNAVSKLVVNDFIEQHNKQ